MCSVQCAVYQCVVCSVQCEACSVYCVVFNVQCVMCSVHFTVCSVLYGGAIAGLGRGCLLLGSAAIDRMCGTAPAPHSNTKLYLEGLDPIS